MNNKQFFSNFYELKEELGKGAFSVVKKGIRIDDKKEFAVKIFSTAKMTQRDLSKLEREAKICRLLKHENIVRLYDVFTESLYQYFVFDIITGGELFEDIVAREFYSEQDASKMIRQLLESVQYIHTQNVIHRDLKPENLLLSHKGPNAMLKLADFGLAVETEGDNLSWFGFAGTPGYLSPEVIKKEPYGKLVDVWACGIILYILLVGYPPFWDEDQTKLYLQIKNTELEFPSPEWDTVKPEAKTLIKAMVNKDPTQRLSAIEALRHPWIANLNIASTIHREQTQAVIKKFNARQKLKGAILFTVFANKRISGLKKKVIEKELADHKGSNMIEDSHNKTESNAEKIVRFTEKFLLAVTTGDMETFKSFCDLEMTCFQPDISGILLQGHNYYKFFFESGLLLNNKNSHNTLMLNPHVFELSETSACVVYTRITQSIESSKCIPVNCQSEETIVWQKRADLWKVVHFHRSENQPNALKLV